MRTAEFSRSDADIAGMILRCAGDEIESLVIVIEPRAPRARPHVAIGALGAGASFEASVVPPFTALLLPSEAEALIAGPWRAAPELSVQVENDHGTEQGVIVLAGLGPALEGLKANCGAR
jgi:hypothetical protein